MSNRRDALVGEIFLAAIELPRSRCHALLDERCGDDPTLRAEVESLLRYHNPDTITDQPVDKLTAFDAGAGAADASELWLTMRSTAGRRRIGVALFLVAAAVALVGMVVDQQVHRRLVEATDARLTAVLDANVAALEAWLEARRQTVLEWAERPDIRTPIGELEEFARGRDISGTEVFDHPANIELYRIIAPLLEQPGILGVNVMSREGVMLSRGPGDRGLANVSRLSSEGGRRLVTTFLGDVVVTPPFVSRGMIASPGSDTAPTDPGRASRAETGASARVVVAAPIRGDNGAVMALLGVRIASLAPMTEALETVRLPPPGRTYAFDERGVAVTEVGDTEELRSLGLIPSGEGVTSAFNLEIRDPGGDLAAGFVPPLDRVEQPLTRMAVNATKGGAAADLEGYRDFLGRDVVGAWTWLPEFGIGVASEMPYARAYGALRTTRIAFGLVLALLLSASCYAIASTLSFHDLRRQAVEARRLGRYRLGEPIGEGGMSHVYLASHAMLQRPVAIKLLKPEREGTDDAARFEREVQLVAGLNHPNTIQVFDYGRTAQGTLFYVMEYVPGITLEELVRTDGALSPARAISILRQVAGSLREAHASGIVHRDIKPTNAMICERADGADIVKVLDFGLARSLGAEDQVTRKGLLGGTPAYIAPERIRDPNAVDARSDIYSFGATAFYLLTGREIVEGGSPDELLLHVLNSDEIDVADLAARGTPVELEHMIARCLALRLERRPQSFDEICIILDRLAVSYPWTEDDARAWWSGRPGP